MAIHEVQILQLLLTSASGLIGVGIGIGLFRGSVKQLKEDVAYIKARQKKIRGEDNGGRPVYSLSEDCKAFRQSCAVGHGEEMKRISNTIVDHTRALKSFENYARWSMQNKGLKIEEINQILMIN